MESGIESITRHILEPEIKTTSSKKPLLLTRPKGEYSNELENVVKMVQKLSNKIVYLEKENGASSSRNPFKSYYKKRGEIGQPEPPLINSCVLNFNEVGMDHFYTFHQEHHYEKSFP